MTKSMLRVLAVLFVSQNIFATPALENNGGIYTSTDIVEAYDSYRMDKDYSEIVLTSNSCRLTNFLLLTAGCNVVSQSKSTARLVGSYPFLDKNITRVNSESKSIGPAESWACKYKGLKKGDLVEIRSICRK